MVLAASEHPLHRASTKLAGRVLRSPTSENCFDLKRALAVVRLLTEQRVDGHQTMECWPVVNTETGGTPMSCMGSVLQVK